MSKGYTSAADVAAFMGVTFTAAQESLAELMIGAAEAWIDDAIKHAWLETGPITEVFYSPQKPYLRVAKPPIVSVTSLSYLSYPGCLTPYTFTADQDYFVQDLAEGIIYSPYTERVYSATIVYVPNTDPVPDEVMGAAQMLAASYMRMAPTLLDGVDPNIIQRYQVGGELEVEFRKNLLVGGVVPQTVLTLLDKWLKNYVVV